MVSAVVCYRKVDIFEHGGSQFSSYRTRRYIKARKPISFMGPTSANEGKEASHLSGFWHINRGIPVWLVVAEVKVEPTA